MNSYILTLPNGLKIDFQTACDLRHDEQARLYMGAHMPGVTAEEKRSGQDGRADILVHHGFSEKTRLSSKGQSITFMTPAADEFSRDICHLLYGIERRALLKDGYYPVHAACAGKDGRYVLLIGHSGAGKSTLAQDLVVNHGYRLFSGNKTVVRFDEKTHELKAVAGTRTMTMLEGGKSRYSYELEDRQYAEESEVTISALAITRLNDGVKESKKLARTTGVRTMLPFFMDVANAHVVVGDYHVFNGNVPAAVTHHLNRNLRQTLKEVPLCRYAGPLPYLSRKIQSL